MNTSTPLALTLALGLSACASPQTATTNPAVAEPVAVSTEDTDSTPLLVLPIPETLELTKQGRAAVQTLGNAPAFGGWAVGYGGQPLPTVAALRTLLAEKNAADALHVIIDHGTLAAQLMAVSGLYFADHARFEQRLAPYRLMQTTVPVRPNGCLGQSEQVAVAELVQATGAMAYLGPNDTLAAWVDRNPGSTSLIFDIAAGSYPHGLRGRP
jgi:hypothetical protein